MRAVSLSILTATILAAVACQPGDLTNQNGGSNGGANTIMAQVAASDVSRPSGPAGTTATVSGTVTFSGVRVDLWDGQPRGRTAQAPGVHVGPEQDHLPIILTERLQPFEDGLAVVKHGGRRVQGKRPERLDAWIDPLAVPIF